MGALGGGFVCGEPGWLVGHAHGGCRQLWMDLCIIRSVRNRLEHATNCEPESTHGPQPKHKLHPLPRWTFTQERSFGRSALGRCDMVGLSLCSWHGTRCQKMCVPLTRLCPRQGRLLSTRCHTALENRPLKAAVDGVACSLGL